MEEFQTNGAVREDFKTDEYGLCHVVTQITQQVHWRAEVQVQVYLIANLPPYIPLENDANAIVSYYQ